MLTHSMCRHVLDRYRYVFEWYCGILNAWLCIGISHYIYVCYFCSINMIGFSMDDLSRDLSDSGVVHSAPIQPHSNSVTY